LAISQSAGDKELAMAMLQTILDLETRCECGARLKFAEFAAHAKSCHVLGFPNGFRKKMQAARAAFEQEPDLAHAVLEHLAAKVFRS
jgi:hypothetical protein